MPRELLTVLLFLAPVMSLADDGRPEEIVRAAIVAAGGADTLARFPAGRVTAKGTLFADGAEVPVTVEQTFHVPGRSRILIRTESKGRKLEMVQIVNGSKVRSLINGATVPTTDAAAKEIQLASLLLEVGQLSPLLSDRKFVLKHDLTVRGAEVAGITLHTKGFPDLRLGFDRKSGHLVRIGRKAPDPETARATDWEQILGGHKAFNGVTRPTTAVVFKDGVKILELTTETFIPLEKTDPTVFSVDE